MDHYILDANNAVITVTKYLGRTNAALDALGAAPLGTADGTATGEVGLKVIAVGSAAGGSTYPIPPAVSTYSPTLFSNLGANATLNVKATAGNVFSLTCHNENAAERYVQLHNTATVPSTGVTVPIYSFLVPALSQIVIGNDFFTQAGVHFATGIAFAFSTTKDVYTAGTASEQSTWVLYK